MIAAGENRGHRPYGRNSSIVVSELARAGGEHSEIKLGDLAVTRVRANKKTPQRADPQADIAEKSFLLERGSR